MRRCFFTSQAKKTASQQNRLLQTTIGTAILFQSKSCIFSSPLTKKLSAVSVATLVTHHPSLFKAPNAFQLLWFRSPSPLIVATVQQRGRCKRKPCCCRLLAALLLLEACRCCLLLLLLAAAACCLRLALPPLPHRSAYACSSLAPSLQLPLPHPNRLPQLLHVLCKGTSKEGSGGERQQGTSYSPIWRRVLQLILFKQNGRSIQVPEQDDKVRDRRTAGA